MTWRIAKLDVAEHKRRVPQIRPPFLKMCASCLSSHPSPHCSVLFGRQLPCLEQLQPRCEDAGLRGVRGMAWRFVRRLDRNLWQTSHRLYIKNASDFEAQDTLQPWQRRAEEHLFHRPHTPCPRRRTWNSKNSFLRSSNCSSPIELLSERCYSAFRYCHPRNICGPPCCPHVIIIPYIYIFKMY